MPSNLLQAEGLDALARYVASDTLFAFDLDGTLAPIVDDYSAAQVPEPVRATLKQLGKLAKVVVITGRARKDALAILGFEPHFLIGNHGAEWPPHDNYRNWHYITYCLKWRDQLYDALSCAQGVEIEFKGESLSLHYRKADDPENAISLINAAIETLVPHPRRIGGKHVVNLLPMEAFTKGQALVAIIDMLGLKRAIYLGDDVTDEEVFALRSVDILGIHIGKEDRTAASYFLSTQSEILGLLESITGMLELTVQLQLQCGAVCRPRKDP